MIPRNVPAFKVLETRYGIACKVGDIVEGCIVQGSDGEPVLGFNSPSRYAFDTAWRTVAISPIDRGLYTCAVLKPLNKAARDLVEALS